MNLIDLLRTELESEGAKSRTMLERAPTEHFGWRPHERSWTLASLSRHIANIPTWVAHTMDHDELDFLVPMPKQDPVTTNEELLSFFDANLKAAVSRLSASNDDALNGEWTMRSGERIFFTLPKHVVLRNFVLNHSVHHRGQLSVYLRLLDVPLPGMYGPTADEKSMAG